MLQFVSTPGGLKDDGKFETALTDSRINDLEGKKKIIENGANTFNWCCKEWW